MSYGFTRNVLWGLSILGLSGCGGSAKPAQSANETEAPSAANVATTKASSDEAAAPAAEDEKVPTKCALSDPCRPPVKWVDALCRDVHPGLGLYLFQQGTPWERRYMTRKTEAVNASGGATREGFLEFDEEVLILKMRKAPPGGMQVSGQSESYDALRWDGSCVTLLGEEVTKSVPPAKKHAFITWRFLDDGIQEALKEDSGLRDIYRDYRKECKGAASGEVSKACEKLDKKMSQAVVEYVRGGGKVPMPTKLP
ncbi:MAG: hypothetical protein QM784_24565 [Polyangiaceae bacterium]